MNQSGEIHWLSHVSFVWQISFNTKSLPWFEEQALLTEGGMCSEDGDTFLLGWERQVIHGQCEAGDNVWPKLLIFLFVESREASRCWAQLLQVWVYHLKQC